MPPGKGYPQNKSSRKFPIRAKPLSKFHTRWPVVPMPFSKDKTGGFLARKLRKERKK